MLALAETMLVVFIETSSDDMLCKSEVTHVRILFDASIQSDVFVSPCKRSF